MRGIEALVKPGTHIRLVFDHHMPCIAKVIVSKGRRVKGPALCPVCDMNKGRPPRRVPQGQRGAGSPGITPPENHRGGRAAPAGQQRPARRGYSTAAVFQPSSAFFTMEGECQQR